MDKKPFKHEIKIADGVNITITANHQLTLEQVKKYLQASIFHESLKYPELKEVYVYRADNIGVIEKYTVRSTGSISYILTSVDRTNSISVSKDALHEYLSDQNSRPMYLEREMGRNVEIIVGLTEEEVRQKVMKYYLP